MTPIREPLAGRGAGGATKQPQRLGPYRVGDEIASSAVTVSYRGEHEVLGQRVVLKTLKATVSPSSPFSRQIDREAETLARLSHEGFVRVLGFARTDEVVWLAVEDVTGPTLAELAAGPRLESLASAALVLQLAEALGHAHDAGIVHRGLRPEIVRVGPGGRARIVDFGGGHDPRTPSLPEPFEVSQSVERSDYRAPEQILGEDAGPAADVFALGVILHELVAGAGPWDDDETAKESGAASRPAGAAPSSVASRDLGKRIRTAPPRPLTQLRAGVPRSLERVVLRALAKRPEDRFEDGRALAAALEEVLREEGTVLPNALVAGAVRGTADPAGRARAIAPPPRRDMAATAAALGGVFLLVVAGAAVIELGLREDDEPAPAPAASASGSRPAGAAADRGYLRVLARPWAEVLVDGDLVDTTPIGRPIPVTPGRHFVTFRHPNAPDEKRTLKVLPGQTVILDVTMRVERFDAGVPPPRSSSP